MPSRTAGRYFSGTLRSIQKTIGSFGSETSAFGSFFSSRHRLTRCVLAVNLESVEKSQTSLSKCPTRGSAARAAIGSGPFAQFYVQPRNRLRASGSVVKRGNGLGGAAIGLGICGSVALGFE